MDSVEALELPESRWADVDGPIHYREWTGPAEGPTFVCVHGLGGSLLNWALVAPGLSKRGRVIALDLAGFGLSPAEGRSAGVGANWRLLGGFLAALDLPPVVLVGNSMGGMIALIQSAHAPESLTAMILVDAAFPRTRLGRAQQPPPRVAALFALYAAGRVGEKLVSRRARSLGAAGLVRETLRVAAANPDSVDPRLVQAMIEQARTRIDMEGSTPAFLEAARSIFRAQAMPARYRALVDRSRTPALVIHGHRDQLVPVASAVEAARSHDNWTLEILEGLGHIPQMEAPNRWLSAVEAWLDRTPLDAGEHAAERPA